MLIRPVQRGVSLVEAMVVVVILAFVLAMAIPNFSAWLAGSRIRATAESLLAGLQYARSEATTRNTRVRFQLTTSVDASCDLSSRGRSWVVDVVDAADDSVKNRCNATPSDTTAPSILQVRAATEAGGNVQVNATASEVVFNGLGRQAPTDAAGTAPTALTITLTPTSGQCAPTGNVTCLQILVSPAGQVRMCNPNIAAGDPQACS